MPFRALERSAALLSARCLTTEVPDLSARRRRIAAPTVRDVWGHARTGFLVGRATGQRPPAREAARPGRDARLSALRWVQFNPRARGRIVRF
jgi:hypothetical protein